MGDYTGFGITVYRMTRKRKKFTAAIDEVIGDRYVTYDAAVGAELPFTVKLGEEIQSGDVRCGTVEELAGVLVDLDPDAIWEMYEEPKHEWLGSVAKYHPAVGLFVGECAAGGAVQIERRQLVEAGAFIDPDSDGWGPDVVREAQRKLNVLTGALQDTLILAYAQETWPEATP